MLLNGMIRNWVTPQAGDAHRGADMVRRDTGAPNSHLTTQLRTWNTPRASDGDKGGPNQQIGGQPTLAAQAVKAVWPTPTTTDAASAAQGTTSTGVMHPGVTLTDAIRKNWATPAARDYKGSNSAEHLAKDRGHHDQLANQIVMVSTWRTPLARDGSSTGGTPAATRLEQGHSVGLKDQVSSHPGPASPGDGLPSHGGSSPESPVLNPEFVTWLMGLPPFWTLPMPLGFTEMIDSGFSATESFHKKPPTPGSSSGDDSTENSE